MNKVTLYAASTIAGLLLGAVGIAACGGAGKDPAPPGGSVVARIGSYPITFSAFDHRLTIEAHEAKLPVPDPPRFRTCISQLEARASSASAAALKERCEADYRTLRAQALDSLIATRWQIAESAEEGMPVSETKARAQLETAKKRLLSGAGEFEKLLATSGKTVQDLLLEFEASEATASIDRGIAANVKPVTAADVARYYSAHRSQYALPELRDVKIIRISTDAEALRVKQEIESGKSFASVVSHIKLEQPIFSKEGLTLNLSRDFYKEKPLADAIFAAKPDVLSGPVKISLGYYIFEVKRVKPPRQQTLKEVEGTIRQQLPGAMKQQAFQQFVAHWRSKWIARTSCSPGYVVPKCLQYPAGKGAASENPETLD
jgi:foldase protein PrsA